MPIQITKHLQDQATRKGINIQAIQAILDAPGCTYPSFTVTNGKREARMCAHHGVQQQKWTGQAFGQKVCVCVYTCCSKAVTAWFDQVETDLRDDQRKAGVTGYRGRDGKWRTK